MPYGQSRPTASASSRSPTRTTDRTGPKISSRATRIPGSTRSRTLGPIRKPSPEAAPAAVEGDLGPLGPADLQVAGHPVAVLAGDDRPHVHLRRRRRSGRPASGRPGRRAARPAGRRSRPPAAARLPAMHRSPAQPKAERLDRLRRLVEVGVGHHDQVVLGPARRLHPLAVPRPGLVDVPGHRRRADERDRGHQRVRRAGRRRTPGRRGRC